MEGDGGKTVIVTGRDHLNKVIGSGKFPYLIRVSWKYNSLPDGFPDEADAELMGRVTDAFEETFRKDKAAYMVAIYTGEGSRDWLFYTGNLGIFNKVFNRALEDIGETVLLRSRRSRIRTGPTTRRCASFPTFLKMQKRNEPTCV